MPILHNIVGYTIFAIPFSLLFVYMFEKQISWKKSYYTCVSGGISHFFMDQLYHTNEFRLILINWCKELAVIFEMTAYVLIPLYLLLYSIKECYKGANDKDKWDKRNIIFFSIIYLVLVITGWYFSRYLKWIIPICAIIIISYITFQQNLFKRDTEKRIVVERFLLQKLDINIYKWITEQCRSHIIIIKIKKEKKKELF